MGFWHTGYFEFHEPTGLDESFVPSPPVYRCQHCGDEFLSPDEVRTHRFEKHPYNRPVLFLRGVEAGSAPIRIRRHIVPDDICASRFERVLINGVSITPGSLGKKLAETTNNTMIVELLNDGVSSQFTFQFEIASEEDLEGVDRCFIDVARRRRLDMRAIEDFIAAARRFPTAIGYCDGVCEYFYGVLAKEQANDSHIPYEAYLEKYTRAADVLKDFNRPLARSICALIEFHFNHFVECTKLAGNTRVGIAAGRFNRWIEGDTSGARNLLTQTFDDSFEKLFTDSETERLITWSVAEPQLSLLQLQDAESIVRQDIPELDRAKIRILLAESHTQYGHLEEAKRNARELRNNQTLGRWAERLLNQLSEKE